MIMKNFKFLYLLLAAVGVVTFTSCTEEWTPGPKDTNMGVFFPEVNNFEVTAEDTSVVLDVARSNADDAASVSLRYEVKNAAGELVDFFSAPASVEFAAGEAKTTLTFSFDGSQLVMGEPYSVYVKLDEAEASTYATSEATFTVIIPEPWTSMGEGIFFDEILCELFAEADAFRGLGAYVEFQQNDLDPNRIRVKNAFAPATLGAMWGGVPSWLVSNASGDSYLEFNITDPNNVRVGQAIDLGSGPGQLFFFNLGLPDDGYDDLVCFILDATPIVLQDGIIKFPQGAVWLGVVAGGDFLGTFTQKGNANGYMQFYLPGTEFVNYDIVAEYSGMKVATDNKTTSAIINFNYGSDVESFKFALVDGNITDATAIVEAIVAGSEEYTIYEGSVDTMEYIVPAEGAGMKTVVAVPYAGGEAQASHAIAYAFYFPGLGSAELPQVEITVAVDSVVGITGNPEYEANYPSDSSMCIYMEANGNEIKSIKAFVSTGVPAEVTPEEALAQPNAEDYSDFIPDMIENGYALAVYTGLTPDTTYDVFLGFTTIYGETKYFRAAYTPTAAAAPEASAMRLNYGVKSGFNFTKANITLK